MPNSSSPLGDLEEAYQRYRLELRRFFALNSRDPQAADDLIQTMYLHVRSVSIKTNTEAGSVRDPRQYLFRVAWNLLHSQNRRLQAERAHILPGGSGDTGLHTGYLNRLWMEDDTSSALQQAELEQVLSQLPRACQVAVLRQYRDNKTYKEIAAELNVSVHAVKKYLTRSLNHFRMHFNRTELVNRKGSRS